MTLGVAALEQAFTSGLNDIGFGVTQVDVEAGRLVASRYGLFGEQELVLTISADSRLTVSLRARTVSSLSGSDVWTPIPLDFFGVAQQGLSCPTARQLARTARRLLKMLTRAVLPTLDAAPS